MTTFTVDDFQALGVCRDGLARVRAFGGTVENTAAGWQAYIDANPEAWRAPLFTAWRLYKRGDISCPDLIWRVARIAFREQPERHAQLRVYGETLGPDNWREARAAAYAAYAVDAAHAADAAAYAADAADAAYATAAAAAYAADVADDVADAAYATADAAAYAADVAADVADAAADVADATADARKRIRAEIVSMAVEALGEVAL